MVACSTEAVAPVTPFLVILITLVVLVAVDTGDLDRPDSNS